MENQASPQQQTQVVPQVMHSFTGKPQVSEKIPKNKVIIILLLMVLLGIGAGYGLATATAKNGSVPLLSVNNLKGKTFGSNDTELFKDTAEGKLAVGGIDGEGQYHLIRPGGESQYVYLTSSLLDLSQFVGKKIKVWGETQKAQKVGWLMDVGRVEVL